MLQKLNRPGQHSCGLHSKKTGLWIIYWLWFAFNFSSYYFYKQLVASLKQVSVSCDLLSILVLTIFTNNLLAWHVKRYKLWFAFNFSSYYFYKQQCSGNCWYICSCDLLSILVLTIFTNNFVCLMGDRGIVVICFQF